MYSLSLFLEFLKAELEVEVNQIIIKNKMDKPEYWIPYGDIDSNYSIIGNQSSNAEKALVEKITNAIDALFMRKCYELKIDPKGLKVPQNPKEALELFYNIKGGNPNNITKIQEEEIFNDLIIMATTKNCSTWENLDRNERELNIIMYDGGEGQSPGKIPKTILSLLANNKKDIPFTQGNFNQGGSGALKYCGKNGYSLVLSRRHPNIIEKCTDISNYVENEWGWTLIREELRPGYKNPVYTYYAPNGGIPTFKANFVNIKPKILRGNDAKKYLDYYSSCSAAIPYSEPAYYGTMIKLYNYQLDSKGPLVSHFKYDLGRCIYDTYLPVRLIDCRKNKFNNETIFRGLKKFLEDDLNEKENKRLINDMFPIVNTFKIQNQEVKVTVYGFNKRNSGKKSEKSFLDETSPILLTLGQQIQGTMDSRILSSSGLSLIKNSLLTIIEFPNITPEFKKDLFMTDRERLVDKQPKKMIQDKLKNFYKNDETIKAFCAERMKSNMEQMTDENPGVKIAVQNLIENNLNIQNLLRLGSLVPARQNIQKGNVGHLGSVPKKENGTPKSNQKRKNIEIREDPTYFIPILNKDGISYIKKVKQKRGFKINFKTDAPEEFFERLNKKGKIKILIDGKETDSYSRTLIPGKLTLYFDSKIASRVGQSSIFINIFCKEISLDVRVNVRLEVIKPEESKSNDSNKSRGVSLGLPLCKWVGLDAGIDGINMETAVILNKSEDIEEYLINKDNIFLKEKVNQVTLEALKEYYEIIFKYSMLFNAIYVKNKEEEIRKHHQKSIYNSIEEAVYFSTAYMASTFFVTEQFNFDMRKVLSS